MGLTLPGMVPGARYGARVLESVATVSVLGLDVSRETSGASAGC